VPKAEELYVAKRPSLPWTVILEPVVSGMMSGSGASRVGSGRPRSSRRRANGCLPTVPAGETSPYRSATMRVLCPECRRKAYMTEEWGY